MACAQGGTTATVPLRYPSGDVSANDIVTAFVRVLLLTGILSLLCFQIRLSAGKALLASGILPGTAATDHGALRVDSTDRFGVPLTRDRRKQLVMEGRWMDALSVDELQSWHESFREFSFYLTLCQFATGAALCVFTVCEWFGPYNSAGVRYTTVYLALFCLLRRRSLGRVVALLLSERLSLARANGELTYVGLELSWSFLIVMTLWESLLFSWKLVNRSSRSLSSSGRPGATPVRGSRNDAATRVSIFGIKVTWVAQLLNIINTFELGFSEGCKMKSAIGVTQALGLVLAVLILAFLALPSVDTILGPDVNDGADAVDSAEGRSAQSSVGES